jgi:hypothetical protein
MMPSLAINSSTMTRIKRKGRRMGKQGEQSS